MIAGLFVFGVLLLLATESVTRCQLIVDRSGRKLRFTYRPFRRGYSLSFADIRAVKSRMLECKRLDSEDPMTSERVVFAELTSGELVLLAIDPDWRTASLYRDIQDALDDVGRYEVSASPTGHPPFALLPHRTAT